MKLTDRLIGQVESRDRSRGQTYFNTRRVTLYTSAPTQVVATVRGTSLYDVDLELLDGTIEVSCSCPVSGCCKHIWATILAAEPKGFARAAAELEPLKLVYIDLDGEHDDEEDDDEEDIDSRYRYQPPPRRKPEPMRPPPPPKRDKWKDQLDALRRDVAPTYEPYRPETLAAERQIVPVVDLAASEQARKLVIDLNTRERKLNGEWGKPQIRRLTTEEVTQLVDPVDRRLIALLAGGERLEQYSYGYNSGQGVSRYRVAGPLLDSLLPLLAESGRVLLRRPAKPQQVLEELTPDLDPPWVLSIGVKPGDKANEWVLAGKLRRGDETMPLSEPALIVPGLVVWNGRFGRFDDAGAFTWVQPLRKIGRIVVPASGVDELVAQLMQMPKLPTLDLPQELSYTEVSVAPTPRLVVKPQEKYAYGPPMLRADLTFLYDGVEVPRRPPSRGFLKVEGKRFILRDPAAELAADRELSRLGLGQVWVGGEMKLEFKPSLLAKLVRELVPAGWKVEADGKLYRQAGEFKLNVRSEQDWFDLDGSASFDGSLVPFPRLLEALRRGESSIPLDDGSFGMVPEEWLKKYGLLAQMGKVEGDSIRFSKAQVGVLDALLASRPEVTFDKQFAKARDHLRKFTGVTAADPPKGFRGELREYQREGLGWLRFIRKFGFGGCLADDMGLGKTVQVLALLAGKRKGPALVVVPKSLIFNWKSEAAKFAPKLKVLDHTGTLRDRTGAKFGEFDIVLTTYGTLRNDAEAFAAFKFDTCVLDESQAAKNAATETAKAVRVVQADHRIAMSGTPVENHLGELWTLFDFLNPACSAGR